MAALTSLSFSALTHCPERKKLTLSSTPFLASSSDFFGLRTHFSYHHVGFRASNSTSNMVVQCMSSVTGSCLSSELAFCAYREKTQVIIISSHTHIYVFT